MPNLKFYFSRHIWAACQSLVRMLPLGGVPLPCGLRYLNKPVRGNIPARRRLSRQPLSLEHLVSRWSSITTEVYWVMIISINYYTIRKCCYFQDKIRFFTFLTPQYWYCIGNCIYILYRLLSWILRQGNTISRLRHGIYNKCIPDFHHCLYAFGRRLGFNQRDFTKTSFKHYSITKTPFSILYRKSR